ncbi:MAG: hypothetical protein AAFX99_14475 [Myxococcota bacterium]
MTEIHNPTQPAQPPLHQTALDAWFADACQRDLGAIQGKFHSHVTVLTDDLEGLKSFCRARQIKVTVIELSDFSGRHQRDVMTTQHYRIHEPDAVVQILTQLKGLCTELNALGLPVIQVRCGA